MGKEFTGNWNDDMQQVVSKADFLLEKNNPEEQFLVMQEDIFILSSEIIIFFHFFLRRNNFYSIFHSVVLPSNHLTSSASLLKEFLFCWQSCSFCWVPPIQ